jgi:tetratricopeptide (TPR) repeat protein
MKKKVCVPAVLLFLMTAGVFARMPDSSIARYTGVIRLKADYAEAYFNRGIVWYDEFEYDRAIEDYTRAIRINQNYAKAYNYRAEAYANKRDMVRARADWEKTLQIDPGNVSARGNLVVLQEDGY